jgi:formate dehydrogenase major subunit
MVIHTNSPVVRDARKTIISFLLMSGNHNCSIGIGGSQDWTDFEQRVEDYDQSSELCPAHSACKLQAYAYRFQVDTSGLVRRDIEYPIEMASPLIVRDFSRCILCGRCVDACNEIQVNNAISHGFRGDRAKIVAMGDDNLQRSECVFCGECIQACPVAALTEKKSRYLIRPWESGHTRTTCYYCGVGCQLDLHTKDDKIMKVTGVEEGPPNLGRLCVRGRFGYDFLKSQDRITHPKIRQNGELQDATWEEALDFVAERTKEIKDKYGPEAIAGISSAKSTNESLYLMQKLFRAVLGSNHLVSPYAVSGLNHPLGELEGAKRIFLIGCDVTEENPVAGTFIKRAVKRGSALLVADSRSTKIGGFASRSLVIKGGTENILVNGIIQQLIERGHRTSDEIKNIAENFPIDVVCETTGISREELKSAVDLLDSEEPLMLVYGARVASAVKTFIRLQELLDNQSVRFSGVHCLSPMNNSQGACDMGILPDYLPGYSPLSADPARKGFEEDWGCSLNSNPGYPLSKVLGNNGNRSGPGIRMLYCAGENLVLSKSSFPDVIKTLESLDFLVVQDIVSNDTLKYAHVVLPIAAWAEEDGTYTNCERRVSRVRCAVPGPEEVKPEIWIYTQLAGRLGHEWPEPNAKDIWEKEITPLIPFLNGITYDRMEDGGLQWPVSDPESEEMSPVDAEHLTVCRGPSFPYHFHHRTLLEHCEGLIETLSIESGEGERASPLDRDEVTNAFLELLEEEEKPEVKNQIDQVLDDYRGKRGGLIPVLQKAQGIIGFLPVPVQNYIALGLGLPPSDVFGVVTFYSFFTMVPRGRHTIRLCLGTACFVKGSAKILDNLERHLKVSIGETTEDREYSLEVVRCLGACGLAPVMVVDEVTHGQLDPKEVVDIVESYRGEPETD